MRWFIRHPQTRLIFGISLQAMTLIPTLFLGASFFETSFLSALLYTGQAFLIGTALAMVVLWCANKWWLQPKAKKATEEFDSTPTGKRISSTIKKICEKNGLSVPYRKRTSGNDGSSVVGGHRLGFFAAAQGWPNPSTIYISDDMYLGLKDGIYDINTIKPTLAHELAHIYHHHTLLAPIGIIEIIHVFLFYLSMGISALIVLNLGFNMMILGTPLLAFSGDIMLLGLLQIPNLLFGLTKAASTVIEKIITRAKESQADLKACDFTSPKLVYQDLLNASADEKDNTEKDEGYLASVTHYYNSFYDTHPTFKQRAEDIALQHPEVKHKAAKIK